jgi:hypothetical protein
VSEAYTIRIFVLEGDPDGVKIVDMMNWTGVGIAFPRSAWTRIAKRPEFASPGIYVLSGVAEGTTDELPTVYVGQGDEIRTRVESHYASKDFWDWGYAFVSKAEALNRAHTTWLEHALVHRAHMAQQCHLDNGTLPKEPNLSESERADTRGFLSEMLRILPLLGVRVFEKPAPVAVPGQEPPHYATAKPASDSRDTIVVPAQEDGFQQVFLGENCWYAIRISGGMLPRIKYIAVYRTNPLSAITHYAPVDRIEPYGEQGKYRVVFSEPAQQITPIPFGDATTGTMQGPRYTSLGKLKAARSVGDLFGHGPSKASQLH